MLLLLMNLCAFQCQKEKTSHLVAKKAPNFWLSCPSICTDSSFGLDSQSSLHIPRLRNWGREVSSYLACRLLTGSKPCYPSRCCLEDLILGMSGEKKKNQRENENPGFEPDGSWAWQLISQLHLWLSISSSLLPKPLNLRSISTGVIWEEHICQQQKWGFRSLIV